MQRNPQNVLAPRDGQQCLIPELGKGVLYPLRGTDLPSDGAKLHLLVGREGASQIWGREEGANKVWGRGVDCSPL